MKQQKLLIELFSEIERCTHKIQDDIRDYNNCVNSNKDDIVKVIAIIFHNHFTNDEIQICDDNVFHSLFLNLNYAFSFSYDLKIELVLNYNDDDFEEIMERNKNNVQSFKDEVEKEIGKPIKITWHYRNKVAL